MNLIKKIKEMKYGCGTDFGDNYPYCGNRKDGKENFCFGCLRGIYRLQEIKRWIKKKYLSQSDSHRTATEVAKATLSAKGNVKGEVRK